MANNTNLSYPSSFCQQFFDENGKPLSSGKLYTYIAGSSTPVVTYKTISGGTESANMNTNPIILDMAGMADLVISNDTAYKFVLFDKNNVKKYTWDNVTAGGGEGGGSSEEIVVEGTTDEINVSSNITQGVKHYVVSLSNTIKSAILRLLGLYENVAISLEGKADKVQGAMTGNLAALDAEGNLTDSGSKVSDFKTKQIAVPDPSASGTGLEFISSVSQNANGELTASKKSVQDGTTAQKGVVKLNNAIDSSSTTEAATPKAVKDAYDALYNKIIARATFLSQAEWAVQSQLPGDPAKVYYVENGTGEDAFTVYVWNTATNTYVEVDESSISLDGYWHDAPTTTGDGNVVTSITLGNNGVPQIVKGITALTQHQDISGKLDKNGDASNTTATFTAAGSRTNISSGEKLSVIFGKIAKWFSDLKAVAFSGSYTDLSDKPTIPAAAKNGVLTIKQNGTSVGTFSANQSSNTEINVTDTTYESKPEASGGTAVSLVTTGDKYTWNHKQDALPTTGTPSSTFAINISGEADMANHLIRAYVNKSNQTTKSWKKIATSKTFTSWDAGSICFLYNHSGYQNEFGLDSIVSVTIHTSDAGSLSNARIDTYSYRSASETQLVRIGSTNQYEVWVKVPTQDTNMNATVLNSYGNWTINTDASKTGQLTDDEFTAYKSSNPSVGTSYNYNIAKASKIGVGSTRLPIFANSDGTLSPMNIDEYYCWAQPTPQWTDVMEMAVWYVQNQCNNEILGSTRNINLNSTHPSLCYLHVKLPELQGAGRYRFTLEFEITNSSGQNGTAAYGVLILDPPTGYSGEAFLAECVYDSNGKAQSSVMNQIHVPPQGSTYRHKLYVDGHTYRVVKTK